MLTDTHTHLDFPDFKDDLAEVLARAEEAGVRRFVTIGTTLEGSRRAIDLAERHPSILATVGVHPGNADEAPDDVLTPLRALAQHPRVVAIGECGLDYHRLPGSALRRDMEADSDLITVNPEYGGSTALLQASIQDGAYKARQAEVFEQQLDLAAELGLNVVIHQRTAWDDTLEILRSYTGRVRAVFHCFGEGPERAAEVLALGHLVSFTGIVTFKNAPAAQASAAGVPADAFMVETDCPFLAPAPHRGKRCEPAHTRLTAERIAALRGISLEELAAQTERTAEAFFRFAR